MPAKYEIERIGLGMFPLMWTKAGLQEDSLYFGIAIARVGGQDISQLGVILQDWILQCVSSFKVAVGVILQDSGCHPSRLQWVSSFKIDNFSSHSTCHVVSPAKALTETYRVAV
jgi:hypothetical protein